MKVNLYKCEICNGCKPDDLIVGILSTWEIKFVKPEESEKHICKHCIKRIKTIEDGK